MSAEESLPVCPGCSKTTTRHCTHCGWLECKHCHVVYGATNSFRYGKAAEREEKAKRRQNGG